MVADLLDKMMAFEDGELDKEEVVELFQALIDNGMAWTLQGVYGRIAKNLIDAGLCVLPEEKGAARFNNW